METIFCMDQPSAKGVEDKKRHRIAIYHDQFLLSLLFYFSISFSAFFFYFYYFDPVGSIRIFSLS